MKRTVICVLAFAAGIGAAGAVESSVSMASSKSPADVVKMIGDFCAVAKWHPAVEKCVMSGAKQRTLSLKGGGEIVETLDAQDATGYSYSMVSSPLPVANYHSTISVTADPKGSMIKWTGKYDAKGAPDADAKKIIDGIYEAGEKALAGG